MHYFNRSINEVFKEFSSGMKGLSETEAKERLLKYGHNVLVAEKGTSILKMILEQFKDIMVWILIIAAAISFIIDPHEHVEPIVILSIVIINAVIGFIQEYKAEQALEALKKMVKPIAVVIRDGKKREIGVEKLVPGDLVVLSEGETIPADSRVVEVVDLKCDEAALTGESEPQIKIIEKLNKKELMPADMDNTVFMGTNITHGHGLAIVTSTGMQTEFGKIAKLTSEVDDETSPLKKELFKAGKFIAKAIMVICIFIFAFGWLMGHPWQKMFLFAVALAVAAVPEGLPATITIALALGVQRMAKKKAIIRHMPSVETLGSTTVICSDKTGTLTKNEMTVKKIFLNNNIIDVTGSGYFPKGKFLLGKKEFRNDALALLLKASSLCNAASLESKKGWKVLGDPTEGSLVVAAEKYDIKVEKLRTKSKKIFEVPFDSTRKMMTTVHMLDKSRMSFVKGAPDVMLKKCKFININGKITKLTKDQIELIEKQDKEFAHNALRVLGVAYRVCSHDFKQECEKDLIFLGLIGMIDPPRPEVKEAVRLCRKAGIRTFIVTGDFGITAKAIAMELGMADDKTRIITGIELNKITDAKLKDIVEKEELIFARVSPEHKMRVVSSLLANGEIVAVTGDGVNDAPALKKADIGVAMGITGTDVSKQASDMILMDDSFATIVSAVREGRNIYDDIKKFMRYVFSSNLGEILTIFFGLLLFPKLLIITVTQILWINLITDMLPALSLGIEPPEADIMDRKPRDKHERVLSTSKFLQWGLGGLVMAIGVLFAFWRYAPAGATEPMLMKAGSVAFTLLVMYQLFNVFNCRSPNKSLFKMGFFTNMKLIGAVLISLILQFAVLYLPFMQNWFKTVPLTLGDWLFILGMSLAILVYDEIRKMIVRAVEKRKVVFV